MLCYLTVCIAVSKSAPYFGGGNFDTTMTIFNNDDTFNDGYTGDTIFYIRLLCRPPSQVSEYDIDSEGIFRVAG